MQRSKKNVLSIIRTHPVVIYFFIAFLIPYGGACFAIVPKLLQGKVLQPLDTLLLFPFMVIGVAITGLVLTVLVDGRRGFSLLLSRIKWWRVGWRWYLSILIPPVFILTILFFFRLFVSPVFTPHFFPVGILFGVVAGFFEEIGWMGFVYPKMRLKLSALAASSILGLLWGFWHMPVIDYLGGAAPHGVYWLPFFLAFVALVAALRVIIVWLYTNTKSILLGQLMHASNTGFLVMFNPAHLTPAQETLWYGLYAMSLWIVVGVVVKIYGKQFVKAAR